MDIKTLQQAESILLNIRHNAIAQNDKNRSILMNDPDFRYINEQYNACLTSSFKSQDIATLDALTELDIELNSYALKQNLPLNNYHCKNCDDTGTTANGKRCPCLIKLYHELLVNGFDCGKPIAKANFDITKLPHCAQETALKIIYSKCRDFTNAFPDTDIKILVFSGNSGLGKSYIVSAIANALIDRDFDVAYCDAYTLNQKFLEHYLGKLENGNAFMQKLYNADLLVIDDLGSEKIYNKVTLEYLKNIFDMRESRHTLITSNLDVSSGEFKIRYGERLHSRINDKQRSFRFIIKGDDLRLKNR